MARWLTTLAAIDRRKISWNLVTQRCLSYRTLGATSAEINAVTTTSVGQPTPGSNGFTCRSYMGHASRVESLLASERAHNHIAFAGVKALSSLAGVPGEVAEEKQESEREGSTSTSSGSDQKPHLDYKVELLQAALKHVASKGWTRAALAAAADDLGLSQAITGVLPRGEAELVEFFEDQCLERLVQEMRALAPTWEDLSVRERLKAAVQMRLEMLGPHIGTWPQALSIQAQPQNAPAALNLLARTMDEICYACGDRSTDGRWYTKRAALAAVYTSTQVYMLTDFSPRFTETWGFLDRRINDMMEAGKSLGEVEQYAGAVLQSLAAVVPGLGRRKPT